jgi:hypothetical protein
MKKSLVLLFVVLGMGTQIRDSRASAALRLSFEGLVLEADRVTVARVVSVGKSYWGPKRLRIYTRYTFEVESDIAGNGPQHFEIIQPGGRVGRLSQRTEGYPTFRREDRLLMFLRKRDDGYRVVGLSQGVFGFHRDGTRELVYQRLEGLSFPGNHGRPLILERPEAEAQIRTSWGKRKAR